MPRIDAHHHLWKLGDRPQGWRDGPDTAGIRREFTLTDPRAETTAARIDSTILVQVLPDLDETWDVLTLAAGSDLVAGVIGWADLTAGTIADVLDALGPVTGGDKLVGIRHPVQVEPHPASLNRPDVRRGLRAVAEACLVDDLLTLPHQLPATIDTLRALPELTFVLVRWRIADLRPYTDTVLEAFGPSRVVFGSDWPVCLLAGTYDEVCDAAEKLTAYLSSDERADIFGGTAARAYRLPAVPA